MNLRLAGPRGSAATSLASSDAGIAQTIALMRQQIDEGIKDARVNRFAIDTVRDAGAAPYDKLSQAQAIFNRLASGEFYFVDDPLDKETVRPAADMLEVRAGDCDDFTVLMCSALGTIGIPSRIDTVATNPIAPGEFSHVYPEALVGDSWVAVDAARPDAAFGQSVTQWFRKRVWDIANSQYQDVQPSPAMQQLAGNLRGWPRVRAGISGLGRLGCDCNGGRKSNLARLGRAVPVRPNLRQFSRRMRGLGDDNTAGIISSIAAGAAGAVNAAEGGPGLLSTVPTTIYGTNPYGSFETAYSPTAIGTAGYGTSALVTTNVSPWLVVLGIGIAAAILFKK